MIVLVEFVSLAKGGVVKSHGNKKSYCKGNS